MSLLKSVLFGSEGSYNIFGLQATFKNEFPPGFICPNANFHGAGIISQLAYKCLNSNVFHWITQFHTHVLVHEIGHALAIKIFTGYNSKVIIYYQRGGMTEYPIETRYLSDWKQTVIDVSGPMGDIAFSTCKMVAAAALKSYLSWPVALVLGSGGLIYISGELLYAFVSASKKDDGDFGVIAKRNNTHLALASIVLISQCALGILAAIKFAA